MRAAGNCTVRDIRASREERPRNCRKTIPIGIAFVVPETDAERERLRHRFDFYHDGVCRRRGGTGDRASAWGDAGESGETAGSGGSQPTNAGTMAALVGGRVHADRVLAIGNVTIQL